LYGSWVNTALRSERRGVRRMASAGIVGNSPATAGRNARIGETRPAPGTPSRSALYGGRYSGDRPRAAPAFAPKDESLRAATEKRHRGRAAAGGRSGNAAATGGCTGRWAGRSRTFRPSPLRPPPPHTVKICRRKRRMPYRTPTPVGRLNKPRRMGEHHRRNSANSPRALGPRGVP